MKSLLAILFALTIFKQALAEQSQSQSDEIILPASPPQKVLSRYQRDFGYHHDRGFYFAATLGPQWNHSIDKPKSKAIRFGGKINAGFLVANGFTLHGSVWGNFLEEASLVAAGPGVGFLFDSTNIGVDLSMGVGRVLNVIKKPGLDDFAETVLAANLAIGKYWWLSGKTSLGLSLLSGIHGFTLTEGKLSSIGWSIGLGLAFLFG
jgi:hypothetical protein